MENAAVPSVTVLMSVYNGERYLEEAIESILNQTFEDFAFLIFDDASTDTTSRILATMKDSRIRCMKNEQNLGLTRSLNKGLSVVTSEFVARMDADDIASPQRLEKQIQYFQNNPRSGIVFTGYLKSTGYVGEPPRRVEEQQWEMLFDNPMAHSTAMFRAKIIRDLGGYDESFPVSQDYELWVRALSSGITLGVVPEILVYLRAHADSISSEWPSKQQELAEKVSREQIAKICPDIDPTVATTISRIWSCRATASELMRGPRIAWRIRKAMKQVISNFAAINRLGNEWQELRAQQFAIRAATDVWYALKRTHNVGLCYEMLACCTLNVCGVRSVLSSFLALSKHCMKKLLAPHPGLPREAWNRSSTSAGAGLDVERSDPKAAKNYRKRSLPS